MLCDTRKAMKMGATNVEKRSLKTKHLAPIFRAESSMIDLKDNIARVQERIAEACGRVSRRPDGVKLVAVSKTVPPDRIRAAYDAGLRDFGENRVQEANAKRAALSDLTVTWHPVGAIQTNKA